jgi:hypothetical protein
VPTCVGGAPPPPPLLADLGQHHPDKKNVKFKDTFNLFFRHGYKAYAIGHSVSALSQDDVEHLSLIRGRAEQINYLFTKYDLQKSLKTLSRHKAMVL